MKEDILVWTKDRNNKNLKSEEISTWFTSNYNGTTNKSFWVTKWKNDIYNIRITITNLGISQKLRDLPFLGILETGLTKMTIHTKKGMMKINIQKNVIMYKHEKGAHCFF